jgi:hypothetical protein
VSVEKGISITDEKKGDFLNWEDDDEEEENVEEEDDDD